MRLFLNAVKFNCIEKKNANFISILKKFNYNIKPLNRKLHTITENNLICLNKNSINKKQIYNNVKLCSINGYRFESTNSEKIEPDSLTIDQYHHRSDETLELLCDELENLIDDYPSLDIELSQGVMTLVLPPNGTYVINKQPPNKQIWLSSPISGPKRYDLINGKWTSLRDGSTMGDLLRDEVSKAVGKEVKLEGVDD